MGGFLLLDAHDNDIRKYKKTDFPSNYYDIKGWKIVKTDLTEEEFDSYKVEFSDNGLKGADQVRYWRCKEDGKLYELKYVPNNQLRYNEGVGVIINKIVENVSNKEVEIEE